MSQNNILDISRFATGQEEAEWWDSNPDFLLQELEQAKVEGRLGCGSVMRLAAERRAAGGRALELDAADATLASKLEERKGIELEAYLKQLVHTALSKEAEAVDQSPVAQGVVSADQIS